MLKITSNHDDIIIYETDKLIIKLIFCDEFYAKFMYNRVNRKFIKASYIDYPKEKLYNSQNRNLDYQ